MANGIKEEINIVQSWANRVNNLATQALRQQEKKVYENALLQIKGFTEAVLVTMGEIK